MMQQFCTLNYKFLLGAAIVSLPLWISSCKKQANNGNNQTDPQTHDTITKLDPVETLPANTNYSPAYEGQTRIFGIKTQTPLQVDMVNAGLNSPWGIDILPNNIMVVTQKSGSLLIINEQGQTIKTILGLPPVYNSGQGGLLDVVVDPLFEQNRMIYWSYAMGTNGNNTLTVAKGKLSENYTLSDMQTVYTVGPTYTNGLHFGGRLLFDQEQNLLITTGDRSDANMRHFAQEKNNGLGKVLRIKKDGTAATNNPFLNDANAAPEVFSYGHRNVQGLAIDKQRNIIYETELGPKGGDEINMIQAGKNYGWPIISYGLEYSGATIGAGITQQAGLEQPLYYWDPVVSPSGMIYYNHDLIPEWKDNLLIGALSGQHIIRIRIKDGKVAGEERLLANEGQRFRDIAVTNSGIVWSITDGGRLYKITPQ